MLIGNLYLGLFILGAAWGDSVSQESHERQITEHQETHLLCNYTVTTGSTSDGLFWYRQDQTGPPRKLLQVAIYLESDQSSDGRLTARLDTKMKTVELRISRVSLLDSAAYYCALRPTARKRACTAVQKPFMCLSSSAPAANYPLLYLRLMPDSLSSFSSTQSRPSTMHNAVRRSGTGGRLDKVLLHNLLA